MIASDYDRVLDILWGRTIENDLHGFLPSEFLAKLLRQLCYVEQVVLSLTRHINPKALRSIKHKVANSRWIAKDGIRCFDFFRNFSWLDCVLRKPGATLFFPLRIEF